MRFFLLLAVAAVATAAILPDGFRFRESLGGLRKVGSIFSGRRPGGRPGDLFRREADPTPFGEHSLERRQDEDIDIMSPEQYQEWLEEQQQQGEEEENENEEENPDRHDNYEDPEPSFWPTRDA